jgi:hypothetical protein
MKQLKKAIQVAKLILPKMGEKKQYVKEAADDGRFRRISRKGKKDFEEKWEKEEEEKKEMITGEEGRKKVTGGGEQNQTYELLNHLTLNANYVM